MAQRLRSTGPCLSPETHCRKESNIQVATDFNSRCLRSKKSSLHRCESVPKRETCRRSHASLTCEQKSPRKAKTSPQVSQAERLEGRGTSLMAEALTSSTPDRKLSQNSRYCVSPENLRALTSGPMSLVKSGDLVMHWQALCRNLCRNMSINEYHVFFQLFPKIMLHL